MCTSSFLAALLNSHHQAAASLRVRRKTGSVKSIALPPTWYSPVCSALQRSLSYRGKFAVVVGAGDFCDSTKNVLDTAVTSGNVYRQKLSHPPVSFQEEQQSWVLQNKSPSNCLFLVWGICQKVAHELGYLCFPQLCFIGRRILSHNPQIISSWQNSFECLSSSRCVGWLATLSVGVMLSSAKRRGFLTHQRGTVPTNPSVRLNMRITWHLSASRGVSLHCQLSEWFTK